MYELKILGAVMVISGVIGLIGRIRARRKHAKLRIAQEKEKKRYTREFLRQMAENDTLFKDTASANKSAGKHRNTKYHSEELAKHFGGVYLPKGAIL